MGWCNYIIIPKLKLVVEVSNSVNMDDVEIFIGDFKKFIDLVEDFDSEIFEKKFKDIAMGDFSKLVGLSESANSTFLDFSDVLGLFLFLDLYSIEYEIISEFDLKKEKYKGYKFMYR